MVSEEDHNNDMRFYNTINYEILSSYVKEEDYASVQVDEVLLGGPEYKNAKYRYLRYSLSEGSKTLYVRENYRLEVLDEDDHRHASDTVPNEVMICGRDKGAYFYVSLNNVTERPSPEWVSALGVEEYTE